MRLITIILITLLLFGCKPDKPVVTPPAPKDTVIVPPIVIIVPNTDTIIIAPHPPPLPVIPIDTIVTPPIPIIPVDTIKPTPVTPVAELKPFEINTDIENETIQDLKDVLKDYKDGREINIIKVPLERRTGQAFYISANKAWVSH